MKIFINKNSKVKYIIISGLVVIIIIVIVLLPFILNKMYRKNAPNDFLYIGYEGSHSGYDTADLLDYYGVVLSVFITATLSILMVIQTQRANKKTSEVNELMLEIQKKELSLAIDHYNLQKEQKLSEEAIKQDIPVQTIIYPKFEISILGYSGDYANLMLKVKNVSSKIVSSLRGIKFEIKDQNGEVLKYTDGTIIPKTNSLVFEKMSLKSMESTALKTNTPNMRKEGTFWNKEQSRVLPKNVLMILSFSCEDEEYNKLYYEASLKIPDTKKSCGEVWDCKRVG